MNDEEFEAEVLRKCNPDWTEEQVQEKVAKEMQSARDYEDELRSLVLGGVDDLKDDKWSWCGLCNCIIISCEFCDNTSCNCGGCDKCDERFSKAIALSWAAGGSLGDIEIPQWYKDIKTELEKQYDFESCSICCFKRIDFATNMVVDRKWAEEHIKEFNCRDHGIPLVEGFFNDIRHQESLKLSDDEVECKICRDTKTLGPPFSMGWVPCSHCQKDENEGQKQ